MTADRDMPSTGRVASAILWTGGVVFLLGSSLYLLTPTLSGTNLIAAIAFPFVCWSVLVSRPREGGLAAIAAFALLFVLALIAAAAHPEPENFRLVRGVIAAMVGTFGAAWFVRRDPALTVRVVKSVLVLAAAAAALQGTFLLFGIGLDPRLEEQILEVLSGGILTIGLPSIFGNANNFSVFAGLVILFFGVRSERIGLGWRLLALLCVLASGSRTVLVLSFAWLAVELVRRRGVRGVGLAIVLVAVVGSVVLASGGESGIYALDRTYYAFSDLLTGDVETGSSIDVRGRSHMYFVTHYGNFVFGSFDASRPFASFRNTGFDDALVRLNPHSFLIELHALFGLFGLAVLLLFAIALARMLGRRLGVAAGVAAGAVIAFYSSVPSSILQFHAFFVLVTLIVLSDAPGARERRGASAPEAGDG
ncbi:MAG: hypothetical protein JNL44_01310 [Gemmatimonadetes bacterium]|nr:hypothetical protein [Gemmatimonadota bacterium]